MTATLLMAAAGAGSVIKNVKIPMRDGIWLAADIYTPDPGKSLPVVMEFIPYRKDDVVPEAPFFQELMCHDYAVARVDVRGTGSSQGVATDEYLLQEQLDGYDAVEWLAEQSFCDGHVNQMGISYGGFTALQVATRQPPHLTSVIPMFFTDDRYTDDCHYRGGLLRKYYDAGTYGNFMTAFNALPPDSESSGEDWAQIWEDHLALNEPYLLKWMSHQTDGPYWRNGSVGDVADRIECPVFMIGGWRDGYPNPPLRLYEKLQAPKKVLIGPWNHALPDVAVPGPRIDYLHEVVRWLDHWCKGRATGIMDEAPIVVYVQEHEPPVVDRLSSQGQWRGESVWPPSGASEQVLYLDADGRLSEAAGDQGSDSYPYVPTVGVAAGLWSGGLEFGLPGDQRPDEAFSLVYTTPPCEDDLVIVGSPRVVLHVSSTASVIGFAATLAAVGPDGSSHLVAKGMLNGTRRSSLTDPSPMVPGEVYDLQFDIDATAWRFRKGDRIRLVLASADWPNVWPTPEPATNNVYRGGDRRSRLVLPVVPRDGSTEPPRFLPSAVQVQRLSDAATGPMWEVIQEPLTGRVRVQFHDTHEDRISRTTVVKREHRMVAEVDPADPASAMARGHHASRIARSGGVVEATSDVWIQGSATHFHVTIDLAVHVNGSLHHSRRWVQSFQRQLL